MSFPAAGLKMLLTADNVDGLGNALLSHGADVPSWKQQIAGGPADFTSAAGAFGALRGRPQFLKCSDEQGVLFDGQGNQLVSPGSAGALNFLHNTLIFDALIVARVHAPGDSSAIARRFLGNTLGAANGGIAVSFEDQQTIAHSIVNGQLVVNVLGGAVTTINSVLKVPELGRAFKVLIRGDGTNLGVSWDFFNWETTPFIGGVVAGNAQFDFSLGAISAAPVVNSPFGGTLFTLALWDRNNSPADLLAINAEIAARMGGTL